jgi:hypothetical protein
LFEKRDTVQNVSQGDNPINMFSDAPDTTNRKPNNPQLLPPIPYNTAKTPLASDSETPLASDSENKLKLLELLWLLVLPVAGAIYRYGYQNRVQPQDDIERGGSPAPAPARGEIVFAGQPPREQPQRDMA